MPVSVTLNTDKLLAALRILTKTKVLVGVPSDTEQPHLGDNPGTNERVETTPGKKPISNAALAYIHSKGEPALNIPARPFLLPGLEEAKDKIKERFEHAAQMAFQGDAEAVDNDFDIIGLIAQNAVRKKIQEGIPPPLQPSTVAARARRRKGPKNRGSVAAKEQAAFNAQFEVTGSMEGSPTTPLYDTGMLVRSISYVKRVKS